MVNHVVCVSTVRSLQSMIVKDSETQVIAAYTLTFYGKPFRYIHGLNYGYTVIIPVSIISFSREGYFFTNQVFYVRFSKRIIHNLRCRIFRVAPTS